MVEVVEEATYVPHHPQKIAFLFSAMRHFAGNCEPGGSMSIMSTSTRPAIRAVFSGELGRAIERHHPDHVVVTEPGEWRVLEAMGDWQGFFRPPHPHPPRMIASSARGTPSPAGRKAARACAWSSSIARLRAETGPADAGRAIPSAIAGTFDAENRKPLPASEQPPERLRFEPNALTRKVLDLVRRRFGNHFGDLEPFGWAVTRSDALRALDHFIADCLPRFGDVQDAMRTGEGFLYHGVISPYLNAGLLVAREVCERAAACLRGRLRPPQTPWRASSRQILGWREFLCAASYWLKMPDYARGKRASGRHASCRASTGRATRP